MFERDDGLVIARGPFGELLIDTGAGIESLLREFGLLHAMAANMVEVRIYPAPAESAHVVVNRW